MINLQDCLPSRNTLRNSWYERNFEARGDYCLTGIGGKARGGKTSRRV